MSTPPPPQTQDLSRLPLPPGSEGYPLLGETLSFLRAPREFVRERQARHGNVFRTYLFGSPTVYMVGSEGARWVFAGENKYLHVRWSAGTQAVLPSRSLMGLTGEAHQARRRLLVPHFTPTSVREAMPRIQAIALRHLARWAERPGPVTIHSVMGSLVFEVALSLILSDAQVDTERASHLFRTWTKGLFTLVPWDVPFTTHGRSLAAKRELLSMLDSLVAERTQRAEQPQDILGSLLAVRDEEGRPLSREVVLDETLLQLLAGHDTTMNSLVNMVYLLAQHPEVRERCREEQRGASLEEPLTLESLRALPYLHQFIQEALRLHPPAGGVSRVTTQDVEFGGYRIPQGWSVMLGISGTQRMEPWTEPERFDPDRMGPERAEQRRQPHNYIPFGGGARVCIGQHFAMAEIAIILSLLLRGYRFELVPGQDLEFTSIPFPHPRSGVVVQFSRR
jgi:cytochrome P450